MLTLLFSWCCDQLSLITWSFISIQSVVIAIVYDRAMSLMSKSDVDATWVWKKDKEMKVRTEVDMWLLESFKITN